MKAAFEQAILDNPDNPEPYAAYADWLTERGDPRGELIQVQLQLEDEGLEEKTRDELRERGLDVVEQNFRRLGGQWLLPAADANKMLACLSLGGPQITGGFIAQRHPDHRLRIEAAVQPDRSAGFAGRADPDQRCRVALGGLQISMLHPCRLHGFSDRAALLGRDEPF